MMACWYNKEWKEKRIQQLISSMWRRPTSLEKQMIEIIKKNNLPYKYTGDGSFLIGRKNPDFVNINGEKICIEVANTVLLHHPENYEKERREYFLKYGWKCIIIKTNKLIEQEVLEKIKNELEE